MLVPLYLALVVLYNTAPELLLFALLIVWVADTGAYFAGRFLGSCETCADISPGKTWEGVIGGLGCGRAVDTTKVDVGGNQSHCTHSVLPGRCMSSVVGDLTVSMFKRTAGVKDSGSMFPGHGGVLDRIDSVAAAAPLFALGRSAGWD